MQIFNMTGCRCIRRRFRQLCRAQESSDGQSACKAGEVAYIVVHAFEWKHFVYLLSARLLHALITLTSFACMTLHEHALTWLLDCYDYMALHKYAFDLIAMADFIACTQSALRIYFYCCDFLFSTCSTRRLNFALSLCLRIWAATVICLLFLLSFLLSLQVFRSFLVIKIKKYSSAILQVKWHLEN